MRKLLVALLLPHLCLAGDLDESYIAFGAFHEPDGDHAGIESTASMNLNDAFSFNAGLGYYESLNDYNTPHTFEGLNIGILANLGDSIFQPRAGIGAYAGNTFKCSSWREKIEENETRCEEDYIAALYPEVGVLFGIGKLRVYPFARRYFDTTSGSSATNAYGIHLGWGLDE